MTLAEYLRVLHRQWWLVTLLTCVALGGAAFYTWTSTPIYTASTKMFVQVSNTDNDIAALTSGSTFTQQRVKSYVDIITSELVLEQVATRAGLRLTTSQLAGEITASSPLDTTLLEISVNDPDPRRAALIANTLSTVFPEFVEQLETPKNGGVSPVKVSLTDPAKVPTTPVSPRVPLNLALGLLVGLGLGVGAAVLRDQTNTSISGPADVERVTGAVPLGVVPFDRTTARQPLVDPGDQTGRAEAFRALRTNLQFTNVDDPPRIIVVSSPLPSDGKSTTSCNIALTLALSGASVALVEGDLRRPTLEHYLGISNGAGLTNVLAGQFDVRDVLVAYRAEDLAVLPAGPTPPNPSELLGSETMAALMQMLGEHFDYVIIDAPPLLPVTDAAVLSAVADGCVLVARHGKTSREELTLAKSSLEAVNARLLGTVLNFAPRKARRNGYDYGYGAPERRPTLRLPRPRLGGRTQVDDDRRAPLGAAPQLPVGWTRQQLPSQNSLDLRVLPDDASQQSQHNRH
ncbi:polysaccharide biosynthesis tyrosine autokinase [Spongisporangium articulatum]|uniref:Polysaccharide biosynthesis tyrosine autokinase n=1 Tax=Spongisporangium articulatum TaxID=3362603 RepID=A0ABW8AT73_9ACTN